MQSSHTYFTQLPSVYTTIGLAYSINVLCSCMHWPLISLQANTMEPRMGPTVLPRAPRDCPMPFTVPRVSVCKGDIAGTWVRMECIYVVYEWASQWVSESDSTFGQPCACDATTQSLAQTVHAIWSYTVLSAPWAVVRTMEGLEASVAACVL